jgi:hypothetical protein
VLETPEQMHEKKQQARFSLTRCDRPSALLTSDVERTIEESAAEVEATAIIATVECGLEGIAQRRVPRAPQRDDAGQDLQRLASRVSPPACTIGRLVRV